MATKKKSGSGVVNFLVFNLDTEMDEANEHHVAKVKAMTAMGAAKRAHDLWGAGTYWIALETDVTVIAAEFPKDVTYRVVTSNVSEELDAPDKP